MRRPEVEILELAPARARLRFDGPFEGRRVRWDCTLLALGSGREQTVEQYLEVDAQAETEIPITVGLAVDALDRPTLLKAAIMICQYKRLRRGRYAYAG